MYELRRGNMRLQFCVFSDPCRPIYTASSLEVCVRFFIRLTQIWKALTEGKKFNNTPSSAKIEANKPSVTAVGRVLTSVWFRMNWWLLSSSDGAPFCDWSFCRLSVHTLHNCTARAALCLCMVPEIPRVMSSPFESNIGSEGTMVKGH